MLMNNQQEIRKSEKHTFSSFHFSRRGEINKCHFRNWKYFTNRVAVCMNIEFAKRNKNHLIHDNILATTMQKQATEKIETRC